MSSASATIEMAIPPKTTVGKKKNGKISIETFLKEYRHREDGFKYEYHDGKVIKSHYAMNDRQQHIAYNLTDHMYKLKSQGKAKGSLAIEKDSWLSASRYRTPDLCYMTPMDKYEAAHEKHPVPKFTIEIDSPTDLAEHYDEKLAAYFAAGVQVVWLLYPKTERVRIYHANDEYKTCQGDDICSAAPVLPEFELPAKEIFKKPVKPD